MNKDNMRVLWSCKYLNSIIYIINIFLFFLFIIMCYAIHLTACFQFCWSLCTVAPQMVSQHRHHRAWNKPEIMSESAVQRQ